MFDHMLTSYSLKGEFDKYGLTEQDITFIKEQIDPKNNKKVEHTKNTENTVTPAHAITSIKQSPVLKGHLFRLRILNLYQDLKYLS